MDIAIRKRNYSDNCFFLSKMDEENFKVLGNSWINFILHHENTIINKFLVFIKYLNLLYQKYTQLYNENNEDRIQIMVDLYKWHDVDEIFKDTNVMYRYPEELITFIEEGRAKGLYFLLAGTETDEGKQTQIDIEANNYQDWYNENTSKLDALPKKKKEEMSKLYEKKYLFEKCEAWYNKYPKPKKKTTINKSARTEEQCFFTRSKYSYQSLFDDYINTEGNENLKIWNKIVFLFRHIADFEMDNQNSVKWNKHTDQLFYALIGKDTKEVKCNTTGELLENLKKTIDLRKPFRKSVIPEQHESEKNSSVVGAKYDSYFERRNMSPDGDCLYHAIGFYLNMTAKQIRTQLCDYLNVNTVELDYIVKNLIIDGSITNEDKKAKYLQDICNTAREGGEWATDIEISKIQQLLDSGVFEGHKDKKIVIYDTSSSVERFTLKKIDDDKDAVTHINPEDNIDKFLELLRDKNNIFIRYTAESGGKGDKQSGHYDVIIPKADKLGEDGFKASSAQSNNEEAKIIDEINHSIDSWYKNTNNLYTIDYLYNSVIDNFTLTYYAGCEFSEFDDFLKNLIVTIRSTRINKPMEKIENSLKSMGNRYTSLYDKYMESQTYRDILSDTNDGCLFSFSDPQEGTPFEYNNWSNAIRELIENGKYEIIEALFEVEPPNLRSMMGLRPEEDDDALSVASSDGEEDQFGGATKAVTGDDFTQERYRSFEKFKIFYEDANRLQTEVTLVNCQKLVECIYGNITLKEHYTNIGSIPTHLISKYDIKKISSLLKNYKKKQRELQDEQKKLKKKENFANNFIEKLLKDVKYNMDKFLDSYKELKYLYSNEENCDLSFYQSILHIQKLIFSKKNGLYDELHDLITGDSRDCFVGGLQYRDDIKTILYKKIYNFSKNAVNSFGNKFLNFSIVGPAGSGKTTLAIIIASTFTKLGCLLNNNVEIVTRADLVGQYVGTTGPKTKNKLITATEGVLFIDEAYQLAGCERDSRTGKLKPAEGNDFGSESVTEIVAYLDKNKSTICVLIAGYKEQINDCFFKANEGMRRRFKDQLELKTFPPEGLMNILISNIKRKWKSAINEFIRLYSRKNPKIRINIPTIDDPWPSKRKKDVSNVILKTFVTSKKNIEKIENLLYARFFSSQYKSVLLSIIKKFQEVGLFPNGPGDMENIGDAIVNEFGYTVRHIFELPDNETLVGKTKSDAEGKQIVTGAEVLDIYKLDKSTASVIDKTINGLRRFLNSRDVEIDYHIHMGRLTLSNSVPGELGEYLWDEVTQNGEGRITINIPLAPKLLESQEFVATKLQALSRGRKIRNEALSRKQEEEDIRKYNESGRTLLDTGAKVRELSIDEIREARLARFDNKKTSSGRRRRRRRPTKSSDNTETLSVETKEDYKNIDEYYDIMDSSPEMVEVPHATSDELEAMESWAEQSPLNVNPNENEPILSDSQVFFSHYNTGKNVKLDGGGNYYTSIYDSVKKETVPTLSRRGRHIISKYLSNSCE